MSRRVNTVHARSSITVNPPLYLIRQRITTAGGVELSLSTDFCYLFIFPPFLQQVDDDDDHSIIIIIIIITIFLIFFNTNRIIQIYDSSDFE